MSDKPKLIFKSKTSALTSDSDFVLYVVYFENKEQFFKYVQSPALDLVWSGNSDDGSIMLITKAVDYTDLIADTVHIQSQRGVSSKGYFSDIECKEDFDYFMLNTVTNEGDTLSELISRLNNILTLRDTYNLREHIDFIDGEMINKLFNLDYFCNIVVSNFKFGVFNYFKNFVSFYETGYRDTKSASSTFNKGLILAYYYDDLLKVILSDYKVDFYDSYESTLFLHGTDMHHFDNMISPFKCFDAGTISLAEFINELAKLLLDNDFTSVVFDASLKLEINHSITSDVVLFNDFRKVFDEIDDRSIVFDNRFLTTSTAFLPNNASLRLASLQKDFSTLFVASLMGFIHRELCIDSIRLNGEEIYSIGDDLHEYKEGDLHVRGSLCLSHLFECDKSLRIHMNEKAFESLKSFIRYSWIAGLIKSSSLPFAHGIKIGILDIFVDDVIVKLNDKRDFILFEYYHVKSAI